MPIKAVIFDMDGLLIDSEPLWQEAEIKSFEKVGIKLTNEMCYQTMGLRVDLVVDYWYNKFPWKNMTKKEVIDDIMQNVIQLVKEKGIARKGVDEIFNFLSNKNIKIALASSSPMTLIQEIVEKLKIRKYFEHLYSAEFEEYGKPHPGVYITAAKMLDVPVDECLAFEDSFNGLLSAKAARMICVCVPDENLIGSKKLGIADKIIPSLDEFNEDIWSELQ